MTSQPPEPADDPSRGGRGSSAGWGLVAASLAFLIALNLRPGITSLGPLLPQIGDDLGIDEALQGLLGTVPILAFALISPFVPRVSARLGAERTVLLAMVLLAAGTVVRSYTGTSGLWLGTVVVGGAIAVGNVLVPVIVKRDFPRQISLATGVYSACVTLGAGASAALAVPFATLWGWQGSLAFWAIPAVIAAVLWLPRSLRAPAQQEPALVTDDSAPPVAMWRRPTAWLVTAFMGLQSTAFYVMVTWLPTIEMAAGTSAERAGVHLLILQIVGVLSGLFIPRLLRRPQGQVAAAVTASAPVLVGVLGLAVAPHLGLLWVFFLGAGTGSSLVVSLTLISLRGGTHHETVKLSGMAQSLGYLLAAVGPVLFGTLGQLTGTWTVPLIVLAAVAVAQLLVAIPAGRVRRPAR